MSHPEVAGTGNEKKGQTEVLDLGVLFTTASAGLPAKVCHLSWANSLTDLLMLEDLVDAPDLNQVVHYVTLLASSAVQLPEGTVDDFTEADDHWPEDWVPPLQGLLHTVVAVEGSPFKKFSRDLARELNDLGDRLGDHPWANHLRSMKAE